MRMSTNRLKIDKANSIMVIAVGTASFLVTFSLISVKSLSSRHAYQDKVKIAQEDSLHKLKQNIKSVDEIKQKYNEFVDRQENIISGSKTGLGPRDGDNARIILDALPSKYDYPALASTIEKILDDRAYVVKSITGTDDELQQNGSDTSGKPENDVDTSAFLTTESKSTSDESKSALSQDAIPMPFSMAAKGSYDNIVNVLKDFRLSIRPLCVQSLQIKAEEKGVELSIQGKSYYQRQRVLNISEEVMQ